MYATGTTPGGPYKEGPGEVNVPISCGEDQREPGRHYPGGSGRNHRNTQKRRASNSGGCEKFQDADETKLAAAKNGTSKREWVKKSLEAKGFEFIDDAYEA